MWTVLNLNVILSTLCSLFFPCVPASIAPSAPPPLCLQLLVLNALTLAVGDNGQGMLMNMHCPLGSSGGWSLHVTPAGFTPARARDCWLTVKARVPVGL